MSEATLKARRKANFTCQQCGSTEYVQGHHQIPGDDRSIIVLCGTCHSLKHPNLSPSTFFNKSHPIRRRPVTTINARAINYHDHEFTLITDDLLSIEEAGVRLGISGRLVNTMIKTHNLSTINFGGVVCIPAAEVARIKERPADSSIST